MIHLLVKKIGINKNLNYEIIQTCSTAKDKQKTAEEIVKIIKDVLYHRQMLVHNRMENRKTDIRQGHQACLIAIIKELMSKDKSLEVELKELLDNDSRFIA